MTEPKFLAPLGPGTLNRPVMLERLSYLPRLMREAYADLIDAPASGRSAGAAPIPAPTVPRPPRASAAQRTISLRSRGSARGAVCLWVPVQNGPVQVWCESGLEKRALLAMAIDSGFWDVAKQQGPFPIAQAVRRDPTTHTADLVVTLTSGERLAVLVKPWGRTQHDRFRRLRAAVEAALRKSIADRVVVVTDRIYSTAQAANAAQMLHAMRCDDPQADDAVAFLARRLTAPTLIGLLVRASGLGGRAYEAVLRSLYRRTLRLTEQRHRVDRFSLVEVANG